MRSSMAYDPKASMAHGSGGGHPSTVFAKRLSPEDDRFSLGSSTGILELAFPGHPLERFVGILDAVLVIGSVGGKQPHDLVGAVGGHMADGTRREVDGLTDLKLVFFQRCSPELERHRCAPLLAQRSPRSARNISAKSEIASKIPLFVPDRFRPSTWVE